jgi:hypothetical protein
VHLHAHLPGDGLVDPREEASAPQHLLPRQGPTLAPGGSGRPPLSRARRVERHHAGRGRYALGDDPVYISAQIGHTDSGELSRSVYASAIRRRERLTGATLREFDRALDWALMGTLNPEEGGRVPTGPVGSTLRTAWQSQIWPPAPIAQLDRATPS